MISSLLVYQYGQARIWFAMSRDGLLPSIFSRVHRVFQTPHISTWIAGLAFGLRRALEHRHALVVYRRIGGGDRAPQEATGAPARLPDTACPAGSAAVDCLL